MGLSTEQVSFDGLEVGWGRQTGALAIPAPTQVRVSQHHQQQPKQEPLKCPRCDSTNTKFCYYNNYNRSQPRHFCKSCRRHWTEGGTLRNVPVGGGRKNKRLKTTTTTATATATATAKKHHHLPLSLGDQKNNLPELLNKSLLPPSSSPPLQFQPVCINSNNTFLQGSSTSNFPFTNLSSFDSNHPSISASFPSSDVYNYTGTLSDPITTTTTMTPPWPLPAPTSSFLDWTSNWSWDDLSTLVSTDLKESVWDESQNKPHGS